MDSPGALTAFKVSYVADKPQIAQQVNTQLASLFIDENVRASQQQSENTTNFLDSQLTGGRGLLAGQEKQIREYEAAHMGELPDQLQSNLQILSGAQAQLQAAVDARDKALQQQAYLNSLATQYDAMGVTETTGRRRKRPPSNSNACARSWRRCRRSTRRIIPMSRS